MYSQFTRDIQAPDPLIVRIRVVSALGLSRLQHRSESLCAVFDTPLHLVGTAPDLISQILDLCTSPLDLGDLCEVILQPINLRTHRG